MSRDLIGAAVGLARLEGCLRRVERLSSLVSTPTGEMAAARSDLHGAAREFELLTIGRDCVSVLYASRGSVSLRTAWVLLSQWLSN